MKYSRQRELIYKAVKASADHPTADMVYQAIKEDCPNISLATVYRNLNLLTDEHMITKIPISGGSDRFDRRLDEHCHMICEDCGSVIDLEFTGLNALEAEITKNTGFKVTYSNLIIHGHCPSCCEKVC